MKRTMHNDLFEYVVVGTLSEVPGVTTLTLTQKDGTVPEFISGQYINVYFPETNTPEGKAYSISSAPHEPVFTLTVRDIGEFSHRLSMLQPGDVITGSLPYGFFYSEREDSDLVLLAGGVGIAPFRSMVRHAERHTPKRTIRLFHSIRTESDAIFREELREMEEALGAFFHAHFVTRETVETTDRLHNERMNPEKILRELRAPQDAEFLICGSISFTRDLWRALRAAGIREDQIFTEAFFTHS